MDAANLISELKRRRVFRVLVGYGVVTFAVLQIVEPIMHALTLPESTLKLVVVLLGLGFPVAVVLAWAFDINEGKIERTPPASGPKASRIGLVLVGIGVLAAAPGVAWYLFLRKPARPAPAAGATATTPSIAVLPFVNLSSDKEQEYFSDGLTEELLNLLAKVPGLKVAARTSAFAFKGKNEDVAEIGQKLHVAHVLEGSVRRSGDQVRITTQLINASDGFHVWSETYDRKLADVFAVQDEIARAVVGALKLKLLPGQAPTTKDRRTSNPEVYNQYLLGRQILGQANPETTLRAVEAFEKSLALDPGYGPAWAGLANALLDVVGASGGTAAGVAAAQERALAAAEKAVALAPDLADGHAARGKARVWARWDWAGGRADMEQALALNPSDAVTQRNFAEEILFPPGKLPEAITAARKATELDPIDTGSWRILGFVLMSDGRLEAAREALDRALAISPQSDPAGLLRGMVDLMEGQPEKALVRFARLSTEWCRLTGVALAQHDLGHQREAQQALDGLKATHAEDAAYQIAQVYSKRGEKERAMDWLERAHRQRDAGMTGIKRDPFLSSLRGDPRYTALLKKMNLPPE